MSKYVGENFAHRTHLSSGIWQALRPYWTRTGTLYPWLSRGVPMPIIKQFSSTSSANESDGSCTKCPTFLNGRFTCENPLKVFSSLEFVHKVHFPYPSLRTLISDKSPTRFALSYNGCVYIFTVWRYSMTLFVTDLTRRKTWNYRESVSGLVHNMAEFRMTDGMRGGGFGFNPFSHTRYLPRILFRKKSCIYFTLFMVKFLLIKKKKIIIALYRIVGHFLICTT